jgi:predicted GIY-YIG superfamily endonuclease
MNLKNNSLTKSKKNSRKDFDSGLLNDVIRRSSAVKALEKVKQYRRGKKFKLIQVDNRTWVEREINENTASDC